MYCYISTLFWFSIIGVIMLYVLFDYKASYYGSSAWGWTQA